MWKNSQLESSCPVLLSFSFYCYISTGQVYLRAMGSAKASCLGFCMLHALLLAVVAENGSGHMCIIQQRACWLSGSAVVRTETENWLLCSLKAVNAKSSVTLSKKGELAQTDYFRKTDFFSIFSHRVLPHTTLLKVMHGFIYKQVLLVRKDRRRTTFSHTLEDLQPCGCLGSLCFSPS